MSEPLPYEIPRRRHINHARAENVQKLLEEAGYFWTYFDRDKKKAPVDTALLNFLVDYLHFTEKEGQELSLTALQGLTGAAYAIYDKEPRLRKPPRHPKES